jgi:hypothetical protein
LVDVVLSVLTQATKADVNNINTAQDAMLNLRIDWEDLQSKLRNRRIDGFEPAVTAMIQLAGTAVSMAAALQAKILIQRERQLARQEEEAADVVGNAIADWKRSRKAKAEEKKSPKSCQRRRRRKEVLSGID